MPGKTKHFQTLNLEGNICLCDCPGLVFPSFANSKAEMMCCGVLPIDTIKDFISPLSLIVHRIPKNVLEGHYKIKLPPTTSKKYTATIFLQVFAAKKGYVTGRGLPNEAQAARIILKDYTTGKLLFCHLRPDFELDKHGHIQQSGFLLFTETATQGDQSNQVEESKNEDDEGNQDEDSDDDYNSDDEDEEDAEVEEGVSQE